MNAINNHYFDTDIVVDITKLAKPVLKRYGPRTPMQSTPKEDIEIEMTLQRLANNSNQQKPSNKN